MNAADQNASRAVPGGTTVKVEFDEGIAWVILNRPEKRNCMNPALNDEMLAVLDALEIDPRCKVLVLTGAGDSFSAGMDLKEFFRETHHLPPERVMQVRRAFTTWSRRLMDFPKATIAMVNGWCFGGAFTPLVSCDLAIAADEATFGLSEINWGIIPAGNVTRAVAATMNRRDGIYYVMTGLPFDGRKAADTGLVNESVPLAELRRRTRELALLVMSKNPTVLRAAKTAFKNVIDMPWEISEDYLGAKVAQAVTGDPEKGRDQGLKQFLDEKSYRPGLGGYRRE